MANALYFASLNSLNSPCRPGFLACSKLQRVPGVNVVGGKSAKFPSVVAKATESNQSKTKPGSIVCADCDGNGECAVPFCLRRVRNFNHVDIDRWKLKFSGAVLCKECKGSGVNSVDHFNGQFKAGGLCWLCRGKREILCGNCNGAGFLGGFMSALED